LQGDVSDGGFIEAVVSKFPEIIHLAYSSKKDLSYSDPLTDLELNVTSAIRLYAAASGSRVRKLLMVSSGGAVYGPVAGSPIVESCPTNPISSYGITKATIDQYGLFFFQRNQVPIVVVRPGNVYGEEQRAFTGQGFIATAIASILKGIPVLIYGDGSTVRDYIHVSDVAKGIVAALDSGNPGEIYNIGTGVGTSNLEILDLLEGMANQVGIKVHRSFVDSRGIDVPSNILDSSKLTIQTGWNPEIRLEDGISMVWDHAMKNFEW